MAVLKTWTYRQDSRQAESPPEADGLRGRRPHLVLLSCVLLPGVHLHLLVVAHQRLVAVAVRLHGAERGLRQAQAWKNREPSNMGGNNSKHGADPPRLASIYQLLLEKQAGRRRRPPLLQTARPTSPGRRTAHSHTKYVSVFDE